MKEPDAWKGLTGTPDSIERRGVSLFAVHKLLHEWFLIEYPPASEPRGVLAPVLENAPHPRYSGHSWWTRAEEGVHILENGKWRPSLHPAPRQPESVDVLHKDGSQILRTENELWHNGTRVWANQDGFQLYPEGYAITLKPEVVWIELGQGPPQAQTLHSEPVDSAIACKHMNDRYAFLNGAELVTASARFELEATLAQPSMACGQDGVAITGSSSDGVSSFYFCSPDLTCRDWNVRLQTPDVVMTSEGLAFTAVIDEHHLLVWRLDSGEVLRIADRLGSFAHLDGAFVLAR